MIFSVCACGSFRSRPWRERGVWRAFRFGLDLVISGTFGIERAPVPAFEFAMLRVLCIGDGIEEQFEAGDAADIFGGARPW